MLAQAVTEVEPEQHSFPPVDWLLREGRFAATTRDLLAELCRRLVKVGLPLWRVTCHQRTLHPLIGTLPDPDLCLDLLCYVLLQRHPLPSLIERSSRSPVNDLNASSWVRSGR